LKPQKQSLPPTNLLITTPANTKADRSKQDGWFKVSDLFGNYHNYGIKASISRNTDLWTVK